MSANTEKRDADLERRSSELDQELKVIQEKAGHLADLRGASFLGVLVFLVLLFVRDEKPVFGICAVVCFWSSTAWLKMYLSVSSL